MIKDLMEELRQEPYWTIGDRVFPKIAGGSNMGDDDDDDDGTGQQGSGGGTLDTSGTGAPGADKDKWKESLSPEARRYIDELQRTARGHSKAARAAQEELEELKGAKLTESERTAARIAKLEKENLDLKQANRTQAIRVAFSSAGRVANALNPDRLWRLIDPTAIDFDDQGNVVNAEDLVADLKRSDPYLFQNRQGGGSADAGRTPAPKQGSGFDMNRILRGATGREP